MSPYFARDYTGAPFDLFGPAHLAALGIVLLVNLWVVTLRRAPAATRQRFRCILAAVLIVNEAIWHVWNWATGQWTIQTMLPLHLCSVFVFLSAYMLVTRNYTIYEYAYFLGIGGAIQALLTPDAGIYGFPHLRFFQVIISHGSIVTAAIYMTVVEGYRPTWGSLKRVTIGANLYMLAVAGVNWVLGSNYLFIARKPDTPSLIDVLGPWPWYIVSIEVFALVLCLILYLPFAIRDRKASASAAS
ncbi:MAG TPA: TIGR02206 family membrane protein [Chloroflexi bacterium]|nr:TIGR02206 family membrane protein [Chloroflexota bacterium]